MGVFVGLCPLSLSLNNSGFGFFNFKKKKKKKSEMEKMLRKDFDIPGKHPSEEAQRRWRSAVTIFRNRRRRFRMVADLAKRTQARTKILKAQ
ncbi:unnamed protein product [Camellia sinensis]